MPKPKSKEIFERMKDDSKKGKLSSEYLSDSFAKTTTQSRDHQQVVVKEPKKGQKSDSIAKTITQSRDHQLAVVKEPKKGPKKGQKKEIKGLTLRSRAGGR